MTDNVVKEEVLYTYEAAINRYEREKHHEWLCRQRRLEAIKEEQRLERQYFCNQKITGLCIALLSFVLLVITSSGIALLGILAGIATMVTKKMVIYNEYYWTHGGTDQWM